MPLQKFSDPLRIFTVAPHPHVQAFQPEVQIIRVLRRLHGAKIAHQLHGGLRDVRTGKTEALGIGHAVVALVGSAQAGVFVGVFRPVEPAGIDDRAAECARVSVHIFCGGVDDDIRAPFERAAVDRRGERVVEDQRYAVAVGRGGEFLNVQHGQRGIGDGLAVHGLRVGAEGGVQLLRAAVGVDERDLDTHALHRDGEEVEAAAVDARRAHQMVARADDVEDRKEDRRHPGARQHGGCAALKRGDARRDGVVRRVLQAGIEIAARLQIEELAHLGAALVFEGGALNDGDLAGFAVFGAVACLYAARTESGSCHKELLSQSEIRALSRPYLHFT